MPSLTAKIRQNDPQCRKSGAHIFVFTLKNYFKSDQKLFKHFNRIQLINFFFDS